MKHRRPPMPATYNGHAPLGTCKWCARDDLPRRKDGKPSAAIRWHGACADAYLEMTRPDRAIRNCIARDGMMCRQCGAPPRLARGKHEIHSGDGLYMTVAWYHQLELDHRVPLWSVAHLPDQERAQYFALSNLWLLCRACHKAKTAREARERADKRAMPLFKCAA